MLRNERGEYLIQPRSVLADKRLYPAAGKIGYFFIESVLQLVALLVSSYLKYPYYIFSDSKKNSVSMRPGFYNPDFPTTIQKYDRRVLDMGQKTTQRFCKTCGRNKLATKDGLT